MEKFHPLDFDPLGGAGRTVLRGVPNSAPQEQGNRQDTPSPNVFHVVRILKKRYSRLVTAKNGNAGNVF
jgi:hypothetical protein